MSEVAKIDDVSSSEFRKAAPSIGDVRGLAWVSATASEAYFNERGTVATQALPIVPMENLAFRYRKWELNDLVQGRLEPHVPGAPLKNVGISGSWVDGSIDLYALAYPIPDEHRHENNTGVSQDEVAGRVLMQYALNELDADFEENFFVSTAWGGTAAADNEWDDNTVGSAGDPFADVRKGVDRIVSYGGNAANIRMIVSQEGFTALLRNQMLREAMGIAVFPGAPDMPTMQGIAAKLGIASVHVADTISSAGTWRYSKDALLIDSPMRKNANEASAMMVASWTGYNNLAPDGFSIRIFRNDEDMVDKVQMRTAWKLVQQSRELGYFITGVAS